MTTPPAAEPVPTEPASDIDSPVKPKRTRTATFYAYVVFGVVVAVLLIDFIAQNGHQVSVHFFGENGHISEALALLIAAVGGAIIVAVPSLVRIAQLRLTVRKAGRR